MVSDQELSQAVADRGGAGEALQVVLAHAEGDVSLAVSNSGSGMPEDVDTSVRPDRGPGIARALACQIGGTLTIDHEPQPCVVLTIESGMK